MAELTQGEQQRAKLLQGEQPVVPLKEVEGAHPLLNLDHPPSQQHQVEEGRGFAPL
jgi:hypothetical protein